jgi:glycosyltransferase involved in cell wall biosynthesis
MSERIKVLILCTNSDEAGAPIHVETVVSALQNSVEFCAVFGEDGPVADRLRLKSIDVRVVSELRSKINPPKDFRAIMRISQIVREFRPNLIHAHSSKAGMLARIIAVRFSIACLYTVHGWGWRGLGKLSAGAVYLIEKVLSYAPKCHYAFVAEAVAKQGVEVLGLTSARGTVIYNGVQDVGFFPQANSATLTVFMPARVSSAKDHESLVRAFDLISCEAKLILCGAGTDDPTFVEQLKKWAPKRYEAIEVLGQRSDVPVLLHTVDIFVLISKFEALPLSIIEAMSAGKAILATNVGGVSELLREGETGLLVEVDDVEGIVLGLKKLLSEASLRANLGRNARHEYLARFTCEKMAQELLNFYMRLGPNAKY